MHHLSNRSLLWRKAVLRLITVTMVVPALLFSFGTLLAGTAQARSSTAHLSTQGSVTVSSAVKHDVSPPLRSIKPARHVAKGKDLPTKLPRLQQGAPNNQHAYVQNTASPSAIPAASNNFDGVGNGFSGPQGTFTVNSAVCVRRITMATRSCSTTALPTAG